MNPGSFVHSEEEDGVDGLPEDSNDATNLPSVFANATERPRALTIHDTNVQNRAQQRKSTLMAGTGPKTTTTPKSNMYGTNPGQSKKPYMAKQRSIGAYHSGSYQHLPPGQPGKGRISDLNQRRADKKKELTKHSSGMLMKASQRNVGMGLHSSSSQSASTG
jgi:hypothetical protein